MGKLTTFSMEFWNQKHQKTPRQITDICLEVPNLLFHPFNTLHSVIFSTDPEKMQEKKTCNISTTGFIPILKDYSAAPSALGAGVSVSLKSVAGAALLLNTFDPKAPAKTLFKSNPSPSARPVVI